MKRLEPSSDISFSHRLGQPICQGLDLNKAESNVYLQLWQQFSKALFNLLEQEAIKMLSINIPIYLAISLPFLISYLLCQKFYFLLKQ